MKSPLEQIRKETRYWMRVFIVSKALAIGWKNLSQFITPALSSGKEFFCDLWRLVLGLLLPLTFLAAPFWLWMIEKDDVEIERRKADAIRKMANRVEEWE